MLMLHVLCAFEQNCLLHVLYAFTDTANMLVVSYSELAKPGLFR